MQVRWLTRLLVLTSLLSFTSVSGASPLFAQDWRETIGFTKLKAEVGAGLETGEGVAVSIVEPGGGPDPKNPEFDGKRFTNDFPQPDSVSAHATTIGELLFGKSTSVASGITQVTVYEATDWVTARSLLGTKMSPKPNPFSVQNHSYIGDNEAVPSANEMLARFDYIIVRDGVTSVVGMNNGDTTTLPQIFGQSYNCLSVGRSDGAHSHGKTTLGSVGRVKPEIVAPGGTTSAATPMVSSVAALLHQKAISMKAVDARRPEVMKAILLAGATKSKFPDWHQEQDSARLITSPLDSKFGAGEVNVHTSYRILSGGEFNGAISTTEAKKVSLQGWDYGESLEPKQFMHWTVEIPKGQMAKEGSILLTWNADYSDSKKNFSKVRKMVNMKLGVWDSANGLKGKLLAISDSPVDNIEHIYLKNLGPGKYTIGVATDANATFGLAWSLITE